MAFFILYTQGDIFQDFQELKGSGQHPIAANKDEKYAPIQNWLSGRRSHL